MKKIIRAYERMSGMMPMVVFMIMYLLGFALLEKRSTVHYTEIHMWLDDRIPFLEGFVIPYYLWFAFVAVTVVYLYLADRKSYDRAATLLYVGMTAFLLISYLFPNRQYLRPAVLPRHNFFTMMVVRLYRTDTSTNVFPSIHVYNTLACMAGFFNCPRDFAKNTWVRSFVGGLGISIILSTVFLKQHSCLDVLGAIALFVPLYVLVYSYDFFIVSRGAHVLPQR